MKFKDIMAKLNQLAHDIRGQAIGLADMPQAFVLLGVGVFVIVLVAVLVQNLQSTQVADTAAYNVSTQGLSAFTNAGTLFPILGLTVMGVVAIGVLFLLFRR